ncbi:DUF2147 domain-containing protein [Mesobaculum littorinae]|uniref:DUF2147 domain-containing protein n=1 Tax=Mesobaculum littorinae TaxID=2486419 RepID=A0A438AKI8_9RHOB|nr:DUF2147 domain-containing protein [Mesobaculum littorinae]RVV99343.1 DUF2147 domain-containing protein [Mesobaculum littorinae]
MKTTLMAAAAALFTLTAGVAAADPAEGLWQTQPGDDGAFAHVRIAPCGDALCGGLERAFGADGQPIQSANIGRAMVWDMQPKGGGAYGDGKVWAPDRDKTYNSRMQLTGDRLRVEGCVFGICRGQTWVRVK